MEQNLSSSLIQPYKTLGEIIGGPGSTCLFKTGKKLNLAVTTTNSFKIYKLPDLKLQLVGPYLEEQITCLAGVNEHLFVSIGNKIFVYKFYHVEQVFESHSGRINNLLLFGEEFLISSDEYNIIVSTDLKTKQEINRLKIGYKIKQILHPLTYLNKILIISDKVMELYNIQTSELIYQYIGLSNYLENEITTTITLIKNSPILHKVAIALSNNKVLLFNLQTDQIMFEFQQSNTIVNMAFSLCELPLLAVTDIQGNLTFWNLNEQNLFTQIEKVNSNHKEILNQQQGTLLEFIPESEELILLTGSSTDNSILQYQYSENELNKFKLIRQRIGLQGNLTKLRFYNDLHLLAISDSKSAELRDFSLLNDLMSTTFSLKINKKNKLTVQSETTKQSGQIIDFHSARNRENDFANIVTVHKLAHKPTFWSYQNRTILKNKIKVYRDPIQITSVFITHCGNFCFIGYQNGSILQINLESTIIQKEFTIENKITSLFIDDYNKYIVVSDDQGSLYFFDFFSKQLLQKCDIITDKPIHCQQIIKTKEYSILFLLILSDFTIQVWDLQRKSIARRFHGHTSTILDACFSSDNRLIFSCSEDYTLRIWDIISGKQIQCLQFSPEEGKKIISIDISQDGELIATAFNNSREINIWHNLSYMKPWGLPEQEQYFEFVVPKQQFIERSRQECSSNNMNMNNTVANSSTEYLKEIKQLLSQQAKQNRNKNQQLKQFTEIAQGRWLPLIHLDTIKEKNKVVLKNNEMPQLPFFLDFEQKDQIKEQLKDQEIKADLSKSKVITKQKEEKMLEMLGNQMTDYISDKNTNENKLFDYLKQLTPSEIDYEFRRNCLGNPLALSKMLKFFYKCLQKPTDFDLKQIYLNTLLNICYDNLIMKDEGINEYLQKIEGIITPNSKQIIGQVLGNSCLIEKLAKIKT